jgi:hypothetical protein
MELNCKFLDLRDLKDYELIFKVRECPEVFEKKKISCEQICEYIKNFTVQDKYIEHDKVKLGFFLYELFIHLIEKKKEINILKSFEPEALMYFINHLLQFEDKYVKLLFKTGIFDEKILDDYYKFENIIDFESYITLKPEDLDELPISTLVLYVCIGLFHLKNENKLRKNISKKILILENINKIYKTELDGLHEKDKEYKIIMQKNLELEEENSSLKKELASLKKENASSKKLAKENTFLNNKIIELNAQIQSLIIKLDKTTDDSKSFIEDKTKYIDKIKDLHKNSIKALKEKFYKKETDLNTQIQSLKSSIGDLQNQNNKLMKEMQDQLKIKFSEIDALKKEAASKEAEIKEVAIREVAIREEFIKEAAIREAAIREAAIREEFTKEAAIREAAIREIAIKETLRETMEKSVKEEKISATKQPINYEIEKIKESYLEKIQILINKINKLEEMNIFYIEQNKFFKYSIDILNHSLYKYISSNQ